MDPITRKETFLAKAGGKSVNTPKPITREEMFLQKIAENGGGSGGVTSWNDLTDRPFGESENEVLLPKTQFVYNADSEQFVAQADFTFEPGRTYVINWNGVEYTATAAIAPYQTTLLCGVANTALLGGENNGLPFAIVKNLHYEGYENVLIATPLDGSTSVTVSIKGAKVTPIPERFVTPDVMVLDCRIGNIGNYIPEMGKVYATKEQIFEAYMLGKRIVTNLPSTTTGNNTQYYLYEVVSVNADASTVILHTNYKVVNFQYEYYTLTYDGDGVYTATAEENT